MKVHENSHPHILSHLMLHGFEQKPPLNSDDLTDDSYLNFFFFFFFHCLSNSSINNKLFMTAAIT